MPSNKAAWLMGSKINPLEIKSAPYTSPRENEIVVKNGAVAINPADWMKQDLDMVFSWVKYPFILGTDVAGEVVEIGRAVTRFKVGDRVLGFAIALNKECNDSAYGGFQTYTVLPAHMTSEIPSTMSYEEASVLPLGVSTAACGLFQKDQLALQYPLVPRPKTSTGKTLLIWGGATSVGCNAIQLAVAAGYEVFTTASPKNFDLVKKLGASQVFDYSSKTVVADLIHAFKGKTTAGAMSIGPGAADACMDILDKCQGDKFISMVSYPMPRSSPRRFVLLITIFAFVSWNIVHFFKCKARKIRSKFVFGSTLVYNEVGKIIYEDFLPQALAEGSYVAAPNAHVLGKGLEHIQAGFDLQKKGVSATKVVVSL